MSRILFAGNYICRSRDKLSTNEKKGKMTITGLCQLSVSADSTNLGLDCHCYNEKDNRSSHCSTTALHLTAIREESVHKNSVIVQHIKL